MAFYCVQPTYIYYLHLADVLLNVDFFLNWVIELPSLSKIQADFHLHFLVFLSLPWLPPTHHHGINCHLHEVSSSDAKGSRQKKFHHRS